MASPQFDKKVSNSRWYSLTYQSNNLLNITDHNNVKPIIAKLLIDRFSINAIHSYIHGTIIFSVDTTDPFKVFTDIETLLNIFSPKNNPPLLFSLSLITYTNGTPPKHYMYIHGSDELEMNFAKSISSFFPKKAQY